MLDRDVRTRPIRRKVTSPEPTRPSSVPMDSRRYHQGVRNSLEGFDRRVFSLIDREYQRQNETLQLIAAENVCSQAVLAALGSVVQNKTTEGMVGARYHGGCDIVDALETLAIERAKQVFGARYANVQPHSGTTANHIVLTAVLAKEDKILSLGLDQGGHVSHGAAVSFTGKFFAVEPYSVDPTTHLLDYARLATQAQTIRPKMIICGASAYPRQLDFKRFRTIADNVGAYLLADISHIAGLVAAGLHPSPIGEAHFTTTSTYKPGGPRGGLILMGRDADASTRFRNHQRPLCEFIDKATFPGLQGTPHLNNIAAKAVFFREMFMPEYRARQHAIVDNAKALSAGLEKQGFELVTGGTDTHMILINVARFSEGLTGLIAQQALEQCGIIVNMNSLPYDTKGQSVTSGIRLGTSIITRNGMTPTDMATIASLIGEVLSEVTPQSDTEYHLKDTVRAGILDRVRSLCRHFPIQ